jgi:hypothetical protein
MPGQTRAEYLRSQISRLEGAIAHLENAGTEIYNNRPPCVFEETQETRDRRQKENHSPEIYKKRGEDFLAEFKEKLADYQSELAELEGKL